MAQKNVQIQQDELQQLQQQTLKGQHVLMLKLLELPVGGLVKRIEDECLENPWLEKAEPSDSESIPASMDEGLDYNPADDYRSEDDIPTYLYRTPTDNERAESVEYGDTLSFYDQLKEQIAEYDLSDLQRQLLEYLIGSLDEDGLLRKPLDQLCDELAIYQGIDATPEEMEEVLHVLWQFDPPGLGARSLQECLRLQIERDADNPLHDLMLSVINTYWDDVKNKRWNVVERQMRLSAGQSALLQREVLRLNPRPGASLGEAIGQSMEQVTPDFVIDIDAYGNLTLSLNNSGIPDLVISADALDKLARYDRQSVLSASAREDVQFTRRYVDRGHLFIHALRQRHETMLRTMTGIMALQADFFAEGDESLLRPMVLEDVARHTGLDISTISRVCGSKYVQTPYGTYPLRWFFTMKAVQRGDEDVSTRKVQSVIRELIEQEDKRHPLSDDRLSQLMQERGYNIARRTITKYREALGFPIARLRK